VKQALTKRPLFLAAGFALAGLTAAYLPKTTNPAHAMENVPQTYIDRQDVVATVNAVFNTSDRREWDACARLFAPEVLLDYQSLSGQPPARLSPARIITAWQGVLPGFQSTQHMVSNHEVEFTGPDAAVCRCYGHAVHYLPGTAGGDEWGVYGTYRLELVRGEGGWKVRAMQYNHKYQHGNAGLPALAVERVKAKGPNPPNR
jgi:hypothetical protein